MILSYWVQLSIYFWNYHQVYVKLNRQAARGPMTVKHWNTAIACQHKIVELAGSVRGRLFPKRPRIELKISSLWTAEKKQKLNVLLKNIIKWQITRWNYRGSWKLMLITGGGHWTKPIKGMDWATHHLHPPMTWIQQSLSWICKATLFNYIISVPGGLRLIHKRPIGQLPPVQIGTVYKNFIIWCNFLAKSTTIVAIESK